MSRNEIAVVAAALTLLSTAAFTQPLAFVACPVFRNVPEMRGCWLTKYDGEWYYLGSPGGVNAKGSLPPQLKHQALVEGVVKPDAPRICGGLVMEPVKVSALEPLDLSCNEVLGAEGFHIPAYNATTGIPDTSTMTPPPKAPYTDQDIVVDFYFDTTFLGIPSQLAIQRAAVYALASDAAEVTVRTFRGATRLSNGKLMLEREDIARERARKIVDSLVDLGVASNRVHTADYPGVQEGGALNAPDLRSAHIVVAGFPENPISKMIR